MNRIKQWFMKTFRYGDYLINMMQENQKSIEKTIRGLKSITDEQKEELLKRVDSKKNQLIREVKAI